MFRVQISLGTVGTGELPVCVLLGDLALRRARTGLGSSRSSRCTWQDSPSALRPDNMSWLVPFGKHRLLSHEWTLTVGRVHALLHDPSRRHRAEDRGNTAASRRRRRSNRLGVRSRGGCLRQHGRRSGVRLLPIPVVGHHGIAGTTAGVLRGRWWIAGHGVGRTRGASHCCCSGSWWIAAVGGLLHGRVAGLERRQCLRRPS